MQGSSPGERTSTSIHTEVEKDKLDERAIGTLDREHFTEKWNADVARIRVFLSLPAGWRVKMCARLAVRSMLIAWRSAKTAAR